MIPHYSFNGYDVLAREIDITDPYQENLLYDVVTAVRALGAPTYKEVDAYTDGIYSIDMVVMFLRWAEKHGYITGHGGYYSKHGGGAKLWNFVKLPKYPYRFMSLVDEFKRVDATDWRRTLFKFLGYDLLVWHNRVIAISKNEQAITDLYRAHLDRFINRAIMDDDENEVLPRPFELCIHTSDHDIKQPLPHRLNRDHTADWTEPEDEDDNALFPDCRHCVHNHGVLYQIVASGYRPHILNTIQCECRPHPIDRTWKWYIANWCKWYKVGTA